MPEEEEQKETERNAESNNKGFTMGELEGKMKKYGLEISLCVIFVLSAIFSLIWGGAWLVWSIILTMILGIIGVLFPHTVHNMSTKALHYIYKEKVTSIIIAVVGLLLSIFLPPLIFAAVGLIAGKSFSIDAKSIE